jgi:hypothetical protein
MVMTGGTQATAITGGHSGIHIESIEVDGARPAMGRINNGAVKVPPRSG